jgi:hypothetical protein
MLNLKYELSAVGGLSWWGFELEKKRNYGVIVFLAKDSHSVVLFKSIVLLLYAHWEDTLKKVARYIKYGWV